MAKTLTDKARVRLDRVRLCAQSILASIDDHDNGVDLAADLFCAIAGDIDSLKITVDGTTLEEVDWEEGL